MSDLVNFRQNLTWTVEFISFAFVCASVILFVLRLLPIYKHWQKRVVVTAFFLNIAVALVGSITYGLSCIPFHAWFDPKLGSKCFSTRDTVIANRVNGGEWADTTLLFDPTVPSVGRTDEEVK
ncbi:MAG: hypothetical protein Q9159_003444 [Coniocarpon cinnabarinum]